MYFSAHSPRNLQSVFRILAAIDNMGKPQSRDAPGWAFIVCATLLAYLPALRGTILWDDRGHITRGALQSLHGLWRIWFEPGAATQYFPLLYSAFWIEHRLWGDAVLGYHLVNVLLHALSACLVVAIARRLALPGAWLAGLLFALHPVCVESVAWIAEQKNILSGVFYFAAALVYLSFDRSRRLSRYWLALALYICALLSKSPTATLPAALLVVIWWKRGRVEWKRDVRPLAPWLVLGVLAGWCTVWFERVYNGLKGPDYPSLTHGQQLLLAGRAIWFYAGKVVWPANLTTFYPRWIVDPGQWWQYVFPAGVLALGIGLWLFARYRRAPLAAFLLFAGTLFPAIAFFNVYEYRYSYVADHYQYLAMLAIILPAAFALARVRAAAAVLLLILGFLTWRQAGDYRDLETICRATIARNPASWMAHANLGGILATKGRRNDAIAEFETALRANPDFWEAHFALGDQFAAVPGRLDDAIHEYQIAEHLWPISPWVHINLGNALLQAGRTTEAITEFETAVRSDASTPGAVRPHQADAHYGLGNAYMNVPGQLPRAIAEYEAALRIDPGFAVAHYNLGNALARTPGRLADAIGEYRIALRLDPNNMDARHELERLGAAAR